MSSVSLTLTCPINKLGAAIRINRAFCSIFNGKLGEGTNDVLTDKMTCTGSSVYKFAESFELHTTSVLLQKQAEVIFKI